MGELKIHRSSNSASSAAWRLNYAVDGTVVMRTTAGKASDPEQTTASQKQLQQQEQEAAFNREVIAHHSRRCCQLRILSSHDASLKVIMVRFYGSVGCSDLDSVAVLCNQTTIVW